MNVIEEKRLAAILLIAFALFGAVFLMPGIPRVFFWLSAVLTAGLLAFVLLFRAHADGP